MAYILDTDVLTILQRGPHPSRARLIRRLSTKSPLQIVTTIISFQEQVRGWLGLLNRVQGDSRLLAAYAELLKSWEEFRGITVLPFDAPALSAFKELQKQRVRVGTMDLRIASIGLARQMTVVTCNTRDFSQVPGLICEDWTI
ncbi:MAG: type II toxin-antitoxin system VapC family toxin [Candidatus Saccharimonas sp.]|nr:type II toxin-antitoxin system VapC family toxin [Planctomycetaceae bacterium]